MGNCILTNQYGSNKKYTYYTGGKANSGTINFGKQVKVLYVGGGCSSDNSQYNSQLTCTVGGQRYVVATSETGYAKPGCGYVAINKTASSLTWSATRSFENTTGIVVLVEE